MSRRVAKGHKSLVVTVSFEGHRLADECLASAYEQVVPLISRDTAATATPVDSEKTAAPIGDVVGLLPSDSGNLEPMIKSKRRVAL